MFSTRTSFDLAPNPLSLALARARAAGRPILDLTESNPTRARIPYDGDAIGAALVEGAFLRYEPAPFGIPSAREAVARDLSMHGTEVDPSRIVLTSSTSEAYTFLFKLLADPGDEVLVPVPSYPLFEHLARLEAVRAVPYRLAYDGAWHADVDSARAAITARTRAVLVVNPNNPTGSYLKKSELASLASLGLPIVSDEVFARFPLREDRSRCASALERSAAPLVFALGGLSKLAGLPQMKLAWMAVGGEAPRVDSALARLEVVADAFLSVGTPVQLALPRLLVSRTTTEEAIRLRTAANLASLRAAVAGSAASVLDAEGGWYATLRLPATETEEAWVLALLEKDCVYVHPGHFFDFDREAYIVVSLLTPEATLQEGINRIVQRVNRMR
ncbi:MAG: pyridoxal phosphate-dependent aminotransferase [Polyangiaceae bacterium]